MGRKKWYQKSIIHRLGLTPVLPVQPVLLSLVSAIPCDDEEDEEEEEDEEDPYTLVGTDDSEFDNTAPPGVVMPMAAPLAHRAPASTPRPDTTTSAAAGSSFIAQGEEEGGPTPRHVGVTADQSAARGSLNKLNIRWSAEGQ